MATWRNLRRLGSITLTPGAQTQDLELKFDPMTLDAVVVTGLAEATERKNLTISAASVDAQTKKGRKANALPICRLTSSRLRNSRVQCQAIS